MLPKKITIVGSLFFAFMFIMISNSVSEPITPANGVNVYDILKKIETRQQELQKNITDVTYLAKTIYKETDRGGNSKKEILVQKRVYVKNTDKLHEEFISMVINGKKLDKDEMKKQSKEWQKNNSRSKNTKSPLDNKYREYYNFKLLGSSVINKLPVWVIEFKSKKQEENYINGKAYILKDKYDIAKVDFVPAKLSSVIRDIEMSLIYSEIEGYWLPTKFEMAMKLDVKVVFNMYYKEIEIEDVYYQHKINTGIEDSLFDS